ncbi:MAG: CHAD domain-containing protein [Methylibium sp.]|uniref:CYTH and CHAD domain-containing protein n=1 Tax=Methylibium sp. TaxID=2067992 RepID=UPI0017DBFAEA|nr:CHAD domain-containing protein [Methylibium sp.]MBA3598441.1 CHAD domain-containing protein [Methylibium sp.]
MREVELKLQVGAAARVGVERAVAAPGASRTRLQAIYFDTADGRLAAAGLALRLRKEGRRWVQTLKAGSAHGLARGEHNVALTGVTGLPPAVDPTRHHGTPPGDALAAALAPRKGEHEGAAPLQARYRTDIQRRHRRQRTRRGTVELAFDRGEIVAVGPAGEERRWPVCELEIELVSGSPRAVIELVRRFAAEHGLWLDTRSKSERGERLAHGLGPHDAAPAVKAEPVLLDKSMSPGQAWAAVLRNVLAQALPNWSEVAAGSTDIEPLHQLRVALRRLRSAHRFFEGWPGVPAVAWGDGVAALFRALGAVRDRDVLGGGLQREVDAALAGVGEPVLPLPPPTDEPPWGEYERAQHGLVLIDLCGELADDPPSAASTGVAGVRTEAEEPGGGSNEAVSLRTLVAARLQHWHAQARRDAKRFDRLSDEQRHRLRKRLKRLRYAIEFSGGLFPRRAVKSYLARLRRAQERLGEFNDVCVAVAAYRLLASSEPRAWFALGWLAARRAVVLAAAGKELERLRKAQPFWD